MIKITDKARRIYVKLIGLFAIIILMTSFISKDNNYIKLSSNMRDFSQGWSDDNGSIVLPYNQTDHFEIKNTLPKIRLDDNLILKCRYDRVVVHIDGLKVLDTFDSYYLGHVTNAGNKEIIIPLTTQDSFKEIIVSIDLHNSFYLTSLNSAVIVTAGEYINELIQNNMFVIFLGTIFLTTGFGEVLVAMYMVLAKVKTRRKYTIESLFFAGMFSITTSAWAILYTRIPAVLSGNMVLPSIVGYICFMLMPFNFICMSSALNDHKSKVVNILVFLTGAIISIEFVLNMLGIMDWAQTTFTCHILDMVCIVSAIIMAFELFIREEKKSEKATIVIGNAIFVTMAGVSLARYLINRESNYVNIFIFALMAYVIALVVYVAQRLGLSAKEVEDYKVTQMYAYTDELTGLGNRRYYWHMIEKFGKEKIDENFAVIYMDLNRLKYVNDNFGHDSGDEMLVGTAECINKIFPDAVKCRMGGDEFAIILPKPQGSVEKQIDNFKNEVLNWKGKKVDKLEMSIGLATLKDVENGNLDELCRIADDRMYEDKRAFYERTGYDRRVNK